MDDSRDVTKADARRVSLRDLRSGAEPCVYCGDRLPRMTVEHIPPRGMFNFGIRPRGLEFAACKDCNEGSKDADQIVSLVSRFYPDATDPRLKAENLRKIRSFQTNYPEVASGFTRNVSISFQYGEQRSHQPNSPIKVEFDMYAVRALQQWGIKFALAMHRHTTDAVAERDSIVTVDFFTNYHQMTGSIPAAEIRDLFRNWRMIEQGRLNSKGQFSYDAVHTGDKRTSASICIIRQSLMLLTSVNLVNETQVATRTFFSPSEIRLPYPFGLPRLSRDEILARFTRMEPSRRRYFSS